MRSTRASAEVSRPAAAVLDLEAVSVAFTTPRGVVAAVQAVSLAVARGECLGVVGESGAGKSQLFLAVMGLLAASGRAAGSARFLGRELFGLPARALDRVRGAGIGMVFQDPMTALTPHLTVGEQITEVLRRHRGLGRAAARARARAAPSSRPSSRSARVFAPSTPAPRSGPPSTSSCRRKTTRR
ncbi:MAG TPA: ATP-binding cassette domain-containing protein [Steroidobacteraceae bacterium]|nr:ATP-binding cassette domain-containing protein [Steroidobacteraceae bacterium]